MFIEYTAQYADWIGRSESVTDNLDPWRAQAAAAMFDREALLSEAGSELPALWHWFFFLATSPQTQLSDDGHPQRGGFMPPVTLPRRMFAGSRMTFHRLLRLGQPAVRHAQIRDVRQKSGRSGELVFVTVDYQYTQGGELCIEEQQDIVYREPGEPVPAPVVASLPRAPEDCWSRDVRADSRLLFRFSALTFNAHRIHYDRSYAAEVEGYPGLVVHGPLTAMLLADLITQNTRQPIATFSFRGVAPLFDLFPFRLMGRHSSGNVELEAVGPDGGKVITATAALKED
ncbi:MAG: MaoC family dehydratase N-terminal domain-containing protein [Pseudomonadota bacterium]